MATEKDKKIRTTIYMTKGEMKVIRALADKCFSGNVSEFLRVIGTSCKLSDHGSTIIVPFGRQAPYVE